MKKASFFFALMFALVGFGFRSVPNANAANDELLCGSTIISGCVGACGSGFASSVTAPVSGLYCFDAVSSLCPTNGAKATLEVGGTGVFVGDVSGGLSFSFWANAGQTISLRGELFNKKSDVVCFWLGQVTMTVRTP